MRSVYITSDKITMETGGGAVTTNELEALRTVSDDVFVLSWDNIAPAVHEQPDSPFLFDYFALAQIKNRDFDIAHLYSGCFTQTVRYLKNTKVKVSYTVAAHDKALSIEEFHRLGMEYPFHHVTDDYLWNIYTEGYRLADVVIAPSTRSANILESMGCKNVIVIPHGVNLPKGVKPIPERFDVAYLGACGPDKGLLYLIQAWSMLNYSDSKLILAGSGTETLETFIRHVANAGLFVLKGRVPDIADVYNACTVYVQPAVCTGFDLEIPEAMSYGRVVIASEGAGASEIITHGSDGFRVPIRDPKAIAEKINYAKGMPRHQLIEMGQKAQEKAKNYTWELIRQKYAELFSTL